MRGTGASLRIVEETAAPLVERLKAGDEDAFSELYRRYSGYVAAIGYRLLGDDLELDDLVQDAFLEVASSVHRLEDPDALKGFIATIAVRGVLRRRAKRKRAQLLRRTLGVLGLRRTEPRQESTDALYQLLARMPEHLRTPWILHCILGETLPDVARQCQASLTTMKRRIADAEGRLTRGLHA